MTDDYLRPGDLLIQRNGRVWSRDKATLLGTVMDPTGMWEARCTCGQKLGSSALRYIAVEMLLEHLNGDEPDTADMLPGLDPVSLRLNASPKED